ncbi:hypothetical protein BDZ89DRAFT_621993 [Hymenopellis radicata]|nr:hypothetical protein BDZ89DRAFT_621993 [Hymenopellis radicata]
MLGDLESHACRCISFAWRHLWLAAAVFLATLFPSGKMNVHVTPSQINWTIVYYSVTVAVNISTTLLIIFRILSVGGLKTVRTYRGVIEVVVESAFLFSATYVVFLATFLSDINAPVVPNSFHNLNWYVTAVIGAITLRPRRQP